MSSKPPITRTGQSGWFGHRTARLKSLAVVGTISLGFAGAAFAAATPASADPAFSYVMVGSDTIQDVMNGFAFATGGETGGGYIASYDAVDPVLGPPPTGTFQTITPSKNVGQTSQTSCSFSRPNGSGQGLGAIDYSFNPGSSLLTSGATGPQPGCVDIARSSSGPGSGITAPNLGAQDTAGGLIYIPFALDAVTGATGPTTAGTTAQPIECTASDTNCTNINSTTGVGTDPTYMVPASTLPLSIVSTFTQANLTSLYTCVGNATPPNDFVAVGGDNFYPNFDAPTGVATDINIHLYLPQSGSGTAKFWAGKVGLTPGATPPACVHQTIVGGPANGLIVEEHDGTDVASDPAGYTPFSIAQFIAQTNGIHPRLHSVQLQPVNGVAPIVNSKLNTASPFIREVYLDMQYGAVVNGAGIPGQTFDPILSGLFASTTSALCGNGFLINHYGFATLPASGGPTPDQCGATSNSLRIQEFANGSAGGH